MANSAENDELATIPEPAWRTPPKRPRQARQPLSRDAIVGAALQILDAEGLDALSMRRVAQELGAGAGSLYWHVADKDELLDLLLDRLVGELDVPPPDPDRWSEQLKEVARAIRSVLQRHRDGGRLALDRWPIGPNAVLFAEGLLAILRTGGLSDRDSVYASQLLPSFVGWFALEEHMRDQNAEDDSSAQIDQVGMVQDYFASLPPSRFPNLHAVIDLFATADPERQFEFGLDVFIGGLVAQAAQRS